MSSPQKNKQLPITSFFPASPHKEIVKSPLKRKIQSPEKLNKRAKKDNTQQTALDLGQKDWQKNCAECGMFYSPGNIEDEETHKKYHKKKNAPIIYNGYKNETIVKEFTDGSYVSVISAEEKNTFRRQKILQIREMIDLSLNFTMGQNWTPVNEKTYIYVNKKK